MATQIYLGNPPPKIKEWIEKNYVKSWPEKTSVVYADGTTWEGLIEGELNSGSIPNIQNTKEVTIGNKVTHIGNWAFCDCTALTIINIPDNVIQIGDEAFKGCSEALFDTTTIPGVKLIDGWVIDYIGNSTEIDLLGCRGIGNYGFAQSTLSSINIPNSVICIGHAAFCMSNSLVSVYIKNVNYIYDFAFIDCPNLLDVTFEGKTIEEVQAMDNYPWGIEDTSIIKVV